MRFQDQHCPTHAENIVTDEEMRQKVKEKKLLLFERNNQAQDDIGKLDKMQVWIEIRDSVSAMLRAGENPVEVMPHIEGVGGGNMKFRLHRVKKHWYLRTLCSFFT